jgi:hypothetical protein
MSAHSARCLPGLVPLPLRSLLLSLSVLGGVLLAPAAEAQVDAGTPFATITHLSVGEEGLRVRIQWSEGLPQASALALVSYDGQDSVNDRVGVTPKPGEETEVILGSALKDPWETGWSQKLFLEDPQGEVFAAQPYAINLDCGTNADAGCALTVTPGPAASPAVVQVSEALDEVLTRLEGTYGDKELDLIGAVSASNPRLLGEALVYSHRLSRFPLSGPCTCVWQNPVSMWPSGLGISVNASNASGTVAGWMGPGAKHSLTAIGGNASGISSSVSGISQVSLRMKCKRWVLHFYRDITVKRPLGRVSIIRFPHFKYVRCTSTCSVRFDHDGRIVGSTFASTTGPGSTAVAREEAVYLVDGAQRLNESVGQGLAFDESDSSSVWSNVGSTGRVDTYGFTHAAKTFPYFASASVANAHSIAIHAKAQCSGGPSEHGAVWTYDSTMNSVKRSALRTSIRNFLWQRGYFVLFP